MMGSGRDQERVPLAASGTLQKTDSRKQQYRGSKLPPVRGHVADKAGQLPHVAPSLHCRTRLAADEISIDSRSRAYSTLVDLSRACRPFNPLLRLAPGRVVAGGCQKLFRAIPMHHLYPVT